MCSLLRCRMQARSLAFVLAITGGFLLLNTLVLVFPPMVLPDVTPACELNKAVLCAELPRSGAELEAVLSHPANTLPRWKRQVWLDFPFIVLYSFMLAAGAWGEVSRSRVRWLLLGTIVVGGGLDVVENIGILSAVSTLEAGGGVTDAAAQWVSVSAQAKFILLCIGGSLACAFVFRQTLNIAVKLACAATVVTCAAVSLGLVWRSFYELGATGIALACFVLWLRNIAAAWKLRSRGPSGEGA